MRKVKVNKRQITNNFFDAETGELVDQTTDEKHDTIVVDSREEFAFVYSRLIGLLNDLDGSSVKLLQWCSIRAQYNTNIISLTKPICEMITADIGLSYQTIKNSTTKLSKAGVFHSMGKRSSTYRIDPRYFWRGERGKRNAAMKYILELECPGC